MNNPFKKPIHPGKYLKLAYLDALEITTTQLASELDVSKSALSRLLSEKAELSYMMAVRLEKRFDKSAEFWMSMQNAHGLYTERKAENTEVA